MILNKTTHVVWNSRNKKYYTDLGYEFTKMGDRVEVDVSHLSSGSRAILTLRCDYCGVEYSMPYYRVHETHKSIDIDCCDKCKKHKIQDVFELKYGVRKISDIVGVAEKRKATNIERYGCENVFANKEIQNKIVATNIEKYGCPFPMQNINVQSKAKQTSLERYGETSHMKTEEYRAMFSGASNPAWKAEKTPSQREEDRSSVEYRSWRKAVFERDHFLCKRCGGRGDWKHGVHAHHILNWSDNEDVRYDVNNGVTLCASCHTLFHSIYGKRNNNVHQFNEFLSYGKKVC